MKENFNHDYVIKPNIRSEIWEKKIYTAHYIEDWLDYQVELFERIREIRNEVKNAT